MDATQMIDPGANTYILWWIAIEPTKPYHFLVWQNPAHDV